jgi:hypothetical protein
MAAREAAKERASTTPTTATHSALRRERRTPETKKHGPNMSMPRQGEEAGHAVASLGGRDAFSTLAASADTTTSRATTNFPPHR